MRFQWKCKQKRKTKSEKTTVCGVKESRADDGGLEAAEVRVEIARMPNDGDIFAQ
jgi:hypothetical protein